MFPLSRLLAGLVRRGRLTVIDADDREHVFAGDTMLAPDGTELKPVTFRLTDRSLYWKLVASPELHAGEAYMDGRMVFTQGTVKDFLELFSANRNAIASQSSQRLINGAKMTLRRFQQANPLGRARENVAHHYDIGNALYRLFLDENLIYSCAYFARPDMTLEQAQRAKLRLVAAKLDLKPGQRVLDIGCGWGDMALYAARVADVEVVGVTLAAEQQKLATERAREAGLSDRVRFELRDYREVEGRFDRIVSIGMFEHVGVGHYDEFFGKVNALLPDDGLMLLHAIGRMSPPGQASPWIRKYIFPGGYSPSMSEVYAATERKRLWVLDNEFLRLHYAFTLAQWSERFQAHRDEVVSLYDERFARMWEFYLWSVESWFRTGSAMVFHLQLARRRDVTPLTRDYMVERQRAYLERERELGIALE